MTFREKVKRVFRSKSDKSAGKPKIEYYRRHECPPSKFKGPFDRDHQKRLAAWSFAGATVEKDRACELSLSPCATYDLPSDSVAPDAVDPADPAPEPVERVDPGTHSNPISLRAPLIFHSRGIRTRIFPSCRRLRLPVFHYPQPLQLQRLDENPPQRDLHLRDPRGYQRPQILPERVCALHFPVYPLRPETSPFQPRGSHSRLDCRPGLRLIFSFSFIPYLSSHPGDPFIRT